MPALNADSPVQYVKGVGPVRARQFAALGIETVADLLGYLPFRYEHEQGEIDIEQLEHDTIATVRGEVRRVRGRWPSFTAIIEDNTGSCKLQWFRQPGGGLGIYVGAMVIATGTVSERLDEFQIVHPRVKVFEPEADLPPPNTGGRLRPVYRGNDELPSNLIAKAVATVLAQDDLTLDDPLPAKLRMERGLPTRLAALRAMHQPAAAEDHQRARRRLAYEELLVMELAMALRRARLLARFRGHKLHLTAEIDQRIRRRFPFPLTAAQDRVIGEIAADLASGRPMTRLLQGDVGSGKTVVALYAALAAIANKTQTAIMAPTEILAQQHFANIERYLDGSRVRRMLLSGGLSRGERQEALATIAAGDVDLVVGTHALVQQDVRFANLALVVVDEQHKFGVVQRADVRTKGLSPHYLVMTATPIPRTLAMTVFGDLDVSVIDAAPPGRGRVRTHVVTSRGRHKLYEDLSKRLAGGEQAYVVCPTIGDDDAPRDENALKSVLETHAELTAGPWRDLRVGLLHGQLDSAAKQHTLAEFANGKLHALVATTVIEVGVDVPTATLMIIEHAERFGLSQLHQLRGRIGRGDRDGECVLIPHARGEKARERLKAMTETTDGFAIAEADLRQRGPGELLGTRQHGLPELRVANLADDFELLQQARDDAFALVAADPELREDAHRKLVPALRQMLGDKLRLFDVA